LFARTKTNLIGLASNVQTQATSTSVVECVMLKLSLAEMQAELYDTEDALESNLVRGTTVVCLAPSFNLSFYLRTFSILPS